MKCKIISLFLLMHYGLLHAFPQNDSLLERLNHTIEQASVYDADKLRQINALRAELISTHSLSLREQFDICQQLYEQFKVFKFDSAFAYAQQLKSLAEKMKDSSRINYAGIKLGFVLLSSGMFKETGDYLAVIDVHKLPDSARAEY